MEIVSRIMVVDDEPHILSLVKAMLAKPGLDVVTAQSAEGALRSFEENSDIALVLSDVQMGQGMSGPELVKRVAQLSPSTAVALMSGDTGGEVLEPEIPLIGKPFLASALIGTIDGLLKRQQELLTRTRMQIDRSTRLVADLQSVNWLMARHASGVVGFSK